ncbi:steroid 5 alpha-reductase [Pochonia chlamydosporia 170]|uniref:Steroid 5 alpha-reductase n=1 Tax=Pochonia chlamydosporia 170 TaxID=1380566 RepID=A0A179FW01_METCM|nr:steroid 5 alpha-reductase [Pochonia chlamydosporia 170]OAQ69794.1 steroid 5 alpha-reductase [Pochonia chlamydosporia 170]
MAIVEGWYPPTRENWETILLTFRILYPFISIMQFFISWYGMGKTSVKSSFNIPGRIAWMLMEVPGFTTVLYMMNTLPQIHGIDDLPWQNRVLAGLFVIHYIYRAILFPFIQPSMSPIHILVALMATGFQVLNGICIGGWLAAYGPVTEAEWTAQSSTLQFCIGISIFYVGLAANFFHDEELREIRRTEQRRQQRVQGNGNAKQVSVEKHYQIPQAGLFRYVLYAHYLCEWVEWFGFLVAAGWGCVPAWTFLVNEVFAMLPRAVKGKKWYIEKFGEEKIRKRWAVLPGVV